MSSPADTLLVTCLCAGWCTTCQAYTATFGALAQAAEAAQTGVRYQWLDIEEHSDALGDAALDIENFPTVLLQRAGQTLFFGTVLPHAATLERLVQAARADTQGAMARGVSAVGQTLAAPVAALAASGHGDPIPVQHAE